MREIKYSRIVSVLSVAAVALVSEAKLKTVWDVGDYVQDGLLANYDGIRNAGAGKPHESTKGEWVDLVGGSTASLVIEGSAENSGEWKENGYRFEGYSYFQTSSKITLGNEFTVQVVSDTDMSLIDDSHDYPNIWACGQFSIYLIHTSNANVLKRNICWKEDSYTDKDSSCRPIFQWDAKYLNAAFDANYSYLSQTPYWINEESYRFERTDPATVPALNYTWGGRKGTSGDACSRGIIHAWRAYSRKLTDSELAWNRSVDEIRFRGANILPVTNVVVEADLFGRYGSEAAGIYMVEGAHTFTAGNITVGGRVYKPVGYKIEEWNEPEKKWGPPVVHDGASYEYAVSDISPKVRLSWIWEFAEGAERVDARHYIQDGLIANYDGIWNSGIEKTHDSTKEEWVDLVGGSTATLIKISDEEADHGEWKENGYRFEGYSYFQAANEIELGNEFTVQLVTDTELAFVDRNESGDVIHDFQNVWASGGNFGIFLNREHDGAIAKTNIIWKEDEYCDNNTTRPNFAWEGKYVNAAFDAEYSYLVQTPYWINKEYNRLKRTEPVSVGPLKYNWGGCSSKRYCSIGVIHAYRAYSRKLTDAELAWNRDIDEIRFHNAMPTTISNAVAVASSNAEFSGNEEGVYLIGGIHIFTADKKTENGVTYAPKFDVESWDGDAGEWKVTASGSGGECVLREADSAVPRRIVWKWFKEGFSVIVR